MIDMMGHRRVTVGCMVLFLVGKGFIKIRNQKELDLK